MEHSTHHTQHKTQNRIKLTNQNFPHFTSSKQSSTDVFTIVPFDSCFSIFTFPFFFVVFFTPNPKEDQK